MPYTRLSYLTLFLLALLSLLSLWALRELRFDYDLGLFFPRPSAETAFFEEFQEKFGSDTDYVVIGLRHRAGIFEADFLEKLERLSDSLAERDFVLGLQGPTRIDYLEREPLFGLWRSLPWLQVQRPESYPADSARIYACEGLVGTYFSPDRQSVILFARHESDPTVDQCATISAEVEALLQQMAFDEYHLAGRCIGQPYYIALMQREVLVFISASILLIVLFLALVFRAWWGVVIPLAVVGLAVLWTLGLMTALGRPLTIISNVLPSILLVVGLSATIHILAKYREELRFGTPKAQALGRALRQVGIANLLTTLTTTIGFLTLLSSRVQPIEALGIFASVGVGFAFLLAYTLLPALLWLLPEPSLPPRRSFWERRLARLYQLVLRRPMAIFAGSLVLMGLCLWGTFQLRINSRLLEDLKDDHPMQQDARFFEQRFAGVRPMELALTLRDSSLDLYAPAVMRDLAEVEAYLKGPYGAGALNSLLGLVRVVHQGWAKGEVAAYALPESDSLWQRDLRAVQRLKRGLNLTDYVHEESRTFRFSGQSADLGSYFWRQRNDSLHAHLQRVLPPGRYDWHLTGTALTLERSNHAVSDNVLWGLLVALGTIALIMGLLFRSGRIVFISLIPNLLPLLVVAGVMGFAGIPLKMSTAIIFTIAFGIAVDDTIHFMSRLRLELQAGKSLPYAMKRTFISTGRAIVLTTLVVSGGFLTLALSDFLGTFYIGLLVSLTLVMALVADLLLLPVLVIWGWGEGGISNIEQGIKNDEPSPLDPGAGRR
jgi:predicted RND superfamily exporter protein